MEEAAMDAEESLFDNAFSAEYRECLLALVALLVAGGPELQEQVGRILGRNVLGGTEP